MNPTLDTNKLLADSTKVAQNAAKTIGANFVQGVGVVPNVITPSSLTSTNPIQLPQTNGSTSSIAGAAVQGATEGLNTGIQSMISAEDKKIADARTAFDSSMTQRQSFIDKLMGKGAAQVQAETTAGIPEKTQALTDITNEYNTKALEYRRMEEAVQKEAMLTDAQKSARLREISRVKNTELADIGIKQAVAQNNLSAAQSLVDRKIDLEYGDLKDLIGYQTDVLNMNKADLTKAEQNQLNLMITDNTRKYEEGQKIGEFAKTVAANGAPADVISRVSSAKTMADAVQAAGQYAGDVTERLYKQEQLRNARLQGQKLQQEIDAGKPLTGEFAGVINSAAGLVANTKKSTVKTNIANAIASQNYPTAYAEIANAVSDGLTGTNKTTFDDARTDIGVMTGMREAIKKYVDAGGDIGFLKGSADTISKKFGQLSVDPKFSALGTQLQREFQAYRNSMTGAAFTPEESREYAAVNPRTNATLDLNLATIDGALNQLTNRVTSTVNARIPDAQKIYDLTQLNSNSSSAGAKTVTVSGQNWVVGQIYEDAKGNRGSFDPSGKWIPQ